MPTRLAIVVTHPIQHFVPFYRALAADADIELRVLFGAPIGLKRYYDAEMRADIAWQMDLQSGYDHEFLQDDAEKNASSSFPSSPRVAERLTAFAPDAVMIYGYNQVNVRRALNWGRKNSVPVVMISDSELLRERSMIKALAKQVAVRAMFRRIDAFLSVGDQNERYYRHYGVSSGRIFRSPFTIDEVAYRAAQAQRPALSRQVRAEFGIEVNDIVALFVGKLSPRKRPQDLVDALARIGDRTFGGGQLVALFAGSGELAEELRMRAAASNLRAHFAGFVNVDRLPGFYAAADILVHPSQADPHPLITSEAACMGLPMVYSDRIGAVGPTDIARDGENVLVYPCGDVAALAKHIETLAADPNRREAMSTRSLEIFEELDVRRSIAGLKDALHAIHA